GVGLDPRRVPSPRMNWVLSHAAFIRSHLASRASGKSLSWIRFVPIQQTAVAHQVAPSAGTCKLMVCACRSIEDLMRSRIIHLINPKTDSLTTRTQYMNRALYSPLAGLLAVAACIPRDQYEVVLTDENIETIDFDLKADLVGISAMTS